MLSDEERNTLLAVARSSIESGLDLGHPPALQLEEYPDSLRTERACFVTLNRGGRLRGCIGHLEAVQPLLLDVNDNAYAAAFRDPRFPPVDRSELADLELHISVLTPAQAMTFDSEQALIQQLRPGEDGLILEEGHRRGTFLPSVWESLPRPAEFVKQLKMKAGLPPDYWSDEVRVSRYATESFS